MYLGYRILELESSPVLSILPILIQMTGLSKDLRM